MTIEFNAMVTGSQEYQVATTDNTVGFSYRPRRFVGSFAAQSQSQYSNSQQRTYSLNVFVRANQDDMPPGMSKVLSILEDSIIKNAQGA